MSAPQGVVQAQVGAPTSGGLPLLGAYANPATSFVGREREVTDVAALLAEARVVTLTGPGGTGKTRLAVNVASTWAARGMEVVFVDCAPLLDAAAVPLAIVGALGIRGERRLAPLEAIVRHIRSRELLLVLDNLERLTGAAMTVGDLVTRCPRLKVLCTSRSPLRLTLEHPYAVPPLPLPSTLTPGTEKGSAVELFVDRARVAAPSFAPTDSDLVSIAEICRRVDGLPLAVELAAARTRHMSPAALSKRLDTRLPLLKGGPADAPGRHQALRDTIAWSSDLLDESAAGLFGALSVFAGGFGLDAVMAVVSEDRDSSVSLLDGLSDLVDSSLILRTDQGDAEPRYAMLDTIREFAAGQLDHPEPLRERHARFFLEVAENADAVADGPEQANGARAIEQDIGNLRAALEWAASAHEGELLLRLVAALGGYWAYHGDIVEGHRWMDEALGLADDVPTATLAKAKQRAAHLAVLSGDGGGALVLADEAIAMSRSIADRDLESRSLASRAMLLADQMELDAARVSVEEALSVAREAGLGLRAAQALHYLAVITGLGGDAATSQTLLEEAIAEAKRSGSAREAAIATVNLAHSILTTDPERATALFDEAIAGLVAADAAGYVGWARLLRGLALVRLGRLEDARDAIIEGGREARTGAAVPDLIILLDVAGDWLGAMGAPADGLRARGASARARESLYMAWLPNEREWFEPGIARDRKALPPAVAEHASATGRDTDLDEAAAAALLAVRSVPASRGPAASRGRGRHDLTPRELEVVALLVDGRSDGEIADELFISRKTASVHVANIKGKLGASSRVETVTTAIRLGLARPTDESDA